MARPSIRKQPALLVLGLAVMGAAAGLWNGAAVQAQAPRVEVVRTPNEGIQPQAAVDDRGTLHLVYLKGPAGGADVLYTRREEGSQGWSPPIRVSRQPGSGVAAGTIRGPQLAVGPGGRVHVVWFGAKPERPDTGAPLLYARLNEAGTAFEGERNLMGGTHELDGGASVAADREGNVYVAWHASSRPRAGEAARQVWVARSSDAGKTWGREKVAYTRPTGACPCCSTRAYVDRQGTLYVLFRTAEEKVNRDMVLLVSRDRAQSFTGVRLDPWMIDT